MCMIDDDDYDDVHDHDDVENGPLVALLMK